MTGTIQTAFSGGSLDRADNIRGDADLFTDRMLASDSRLILFAGGRVITLGNGMPAWFHPSLAEKFKVQELVFLGLEDGNHHYAADVPEFELPGPLPGDEYKSRDMRSLGMQHMADQGAPGFGGLLAQARGILNWHATHQHCAKCGAPSISVKGGYERKCQAESCGASHFPRTDPVVIMTAEDAGGRLLLGRSPHFVPGVFSALAGFMEPGETIEEAVRRELMEEAGITAGEVNIVANQPWPFPSSLMIGCHAVATSTDIFLDGSELEDARWFTKAEVQDMTKTTPEDGKPFLPPSVAIARNLVDWWLEKA